MSELQAEFARWELDGRAVRQRMYGAPTARERSRTATMGRAKMARAANTLPMTTCHGPVKALPRLKFTARPVAVETPT